MKKITTLFVAGVLATSLAAPVVAQDLLQGAEATAKRQALMKSNGGTLRGAGSATGDAAVTAAQTLVDNFTALQTLWPEDSMDGASKALPAVWSDKDAFDVAMLAGLDASKALLAAASSGDMQAYGAAAKAVGSTCGACHQTYKGK